MTPDTKRRAVEAIAEIMCKEYVDTRGVDRADPRAVEDLRRVALSIVDTVIAVIEAEAWQPIDQLPADERGDFLVETKDGGLRLGNLDSGGWGLQYDQGAPADAIRFRRVNPPPGVTK